MKRRNITITKVNGKIQFLSEVYPIIETNTILNKTITGIGATYSEIKAPRNSIIIEPSKPVIYGKTTSAKHYKDNLLAVVEGVYQPQIIDYIEDSIRHNKWIKILTTPESFKKVQNAFECLEIDIRTDGYFLLFDEIQKAVKDNGYRPEITMPMDFFFECRNKAIVSATPPKKIIDKRLKDFQVVKLVPNFDYKINIKLCATNNVFQCTQDLLKLLNSDNKPVFLFVNSVAIIASMIKQLDIVEQSAVFCSSNSFETIKNMNIKTAYDNWEETKMARYNWMTSRFYSSFDIEISELPNIIMLTDCYIADYTMIEPYTDAVQIVGRFRNGFNMIYHISNFNPQLPIKNRENVKETILSMKMVYSYLKEMAKTASTPSQREAFRDTLDIVPYKQFLNEHNKIDPYKVDNYINEEIIKGLYNNSLKLLYTYEEYDYFNVDYLPVIYTMGDYERLKIENKSLTIKERQKEIISQLEQLGACETLEMKQYKSELKSIDPFIVEAFDLIGKDEIERLNYSHTKIKAAMLLKRHQMKAHSTDAIDIINTYFHEGQWYSAKYIKSTLIDIFNKLDIPIKPIPTSKTIEEFFDVVEHRTKKQRGYYLIKSKFIQR